MARRDDTLIRDWETRLAVSALARQILGTLNERKAVAERCALDGLQRENAQFERAASPQFRDEALGHCNDILQLMLAVATGRASRLGPEPVGFVHNPAVRPARPRFAPGGSLKT